jgi:hypothetical protein
MIRKHSYNANRDKQISTREPKLAFEDQSGTEENQNSTKTPPRG